MPRQLKEIKDFNLGTILNLSEKDIPEDAAAYSLNIDPLSENGILNSIKCDRKFFTSNEKSSFLEAPISWGIFGISGSDAGTLQEINRVHISDISMFDNKTLSEISFIGTQGKKENVTVSEIHPWYEIVTVNGSTGPVQVMHYPSAAINPGDDNFTYLTNTNTISETCSHIVFTGFTNGVATMEIDSSGLSHHDEDEFTLVTPDGRSVTYQLEQHDTPGDVATGDIDSGKTMIKMPSANIALISDQIKIAIEHANGHGGRISVVQTNQDYTRDLLTLTYVIKSINEYLVEGDWITLDTSTFSANSEIMQVSFIDTDNNKIYVKRGCFGTESQTYAASTGLNNGLFVHSNRMTIDAVQNRTMRGACTLTDWGNYSANHIGGNSNFIMHKKGQAENPFHVGGRVAVGTNSVAFSAATKKITLGGDPNWTGISSINEGETINVYDSGASPNNAFSAKVLKIDTTADTILLDTAPTDETSDGTYVYFESNILKNHTLHHKEDKADTEICHDWLICGYKRAGTGMGDDPFRPTNEVGTWDYDSAPGNNITHDIDGGGYWETSPGNVDLALTTYSSNDRTQDLAASFYPFEANDRFVKLAAEYSDTLLNVSGTFADSENANSLMLSGVSTVPSADGHLATNDIIKIDSEYMKVLSVNKNNITVKRGYLGSTIAEHTNGTAIEKNINLHIKQSVANTLMKPGQSYRLSFYASDNDDGGYGALSISFNGGYIQEDGIWTESSTDETLGYWDSPSNIMQENKWINFNKITKPNGDSATNTATGIDNIWRKFSFIFHCPIGMKFNTTIDVAFATRGQDGKYYNLDLLDLSENTEITVSDNSSLLKTSALLDNSGVKELVAYDSLESRLKVLHNVFKNSFLPEELSSEWSLSPYAAGNISSSDNNAAMIANNREMHIGFGGKDEDTSPQWLGYINHKVFGQDYENQLYQDEDTVHTYDEEGTGTLSKLCLAGEFERLEATVSGADLTVTFTHSGYLNVGDNIVVREWMDTDNSWDGNGVWVVTDTSAADEFVCQRADTLDKDASGNPQNELISFRPYFYYGIKDGEPSIYRVWPDVRILDNDEFDTNYPKGKIEKSLPIAFGVTSICTFYNKSQEAVNGAGLGGGKIYALSSTSDEVLVIDVMKKYDEWTTSKLVENANIDLVFKSFKWSNDHKNGDIGGTAEVFGGLASESSPTIKYAGLLSDIIETKGPTNTYDHTTATSANDTVDCEDFDTRLWIQCRQTGEEGFSEGDRFLFAARTEETNTDGPDVLYCADRTPPTTVVSNCRARYSTGGSKFNAGPGANPNDATHGKRSYFYHYYDDDDGKQKLSRLAVVRDGDGTNHGHGGQIQTQHYDRPYINFGYNVGFDFDAGMPAIIVAKYGLFQMADNDGDGVIDGTGVVVPSTTSIDTAGASETKKTGPYGRLHQRVCGHAVGLIGAATDGSWYRHWGRLHGRMDKSGDDYFISRYGDGPHEDSPEAMKMEKCIFVSTDMHYGDDQPEETYTWESRVAADSGGLTGNETDLVMASSFDLTTLEVGDMVYLKAADGTVNTTTISYIDPSANKIRVPLATATINDDDGTLYPFAIHPTFHFDSAGVLNTEIAHHWAFDDSDSTNGDIFTEGPGSGHYTKTYMTPSAYWGGPKTASSTSGGTQDRVNPGLVWKHEKLSFRGGVMIRPFAMDNDDFNNLIVGNGIYIDMPSWPNAVYHKPQSSKIHYNVGNTDATSPGAFASKLFITCPIPADTDQRSNVYMCDMNFAYPDESSQEEITQVVGGATTNEWNEGVSWDICCAGLVDDYITASATTPDIKRDALEHPVVVLGGDDFTGINSNIFAASSYYRDKINALAGLCISVMDKNTGAIETRYIVGSQRAGAGATDDIYVKVHYPFGHAPEVDDKFWIWKHSLACTAPIRLYKTNTLPHGLGDALKGDPILTDTIYKSSGTSVTNGIDWSSDETTFECSTKHGLTTGDLVEITDTTTYDGIYTITVISPTKFKFSHDGTASNEEGNWKLPSDHSKSSVANPLTVSLSRPLMLTTFGGLDMRKTKSYTITTEASPSASEQRLTADANHLLKTGDAITYNSNTDTMDGTYILDYEAPTTIDVETTDTTAVGTLTNTATTNQFEMLIAGTSARSEMGELRGGFTQWDKGDIAGNIQRYDSTADADRFINYGESSVNISPTSLANQPGDYFFKNQRYYYKISFIYDGYQEGPLSDSYWSHYDTSTRAKLSVSIKVRNVSRRLSHVCLYRKDNLNDFYKLVKEIPTESGWNSDGTYYSYLLGDEGQVGASYEARTGMSEILDTIKLKYGISTEIDGYLFAGDCSHNKVKSASNMVFRSRPGMFSIFDYVNDFLTLKSKPTALANFNGRLYAFDLNNIYKINQQNLSIEDIYEGVGCVGKDSLVVTEYGMFFADKTGAYMHNGQQPIKISEVIQKGGDTEVSFGGTDNIRDVSWTNVVTNSLDSKPYVIYDSNTSSVLFNVEFKDKMTLTAEKNLVLKKQYIWSYNIPRKRWDLWELSENAEVGKPFIGLKGEVYIPLNNIVYESRGGSSNMDYTWVSKKITMGEDSIVKVFNKVKLNGLTSDINLGGAYIDSSDKLLLTTSTGDIATGDITYSTGSSTDTDYKLSGTNKKGRWLQLKAENMTSPIDSIGIIFRRKSTK